MDLSTRYPDRSKKYIEMTEDELRANWLERGFSFETANLELEKGVSNAVHENQDELFVNVNGKTQVTLEGKTFQLKRNQELFIPARCKHSIKNIGTNHSKIYYGYKQLK